MYDSVGRPNQFPPVRTHNIDIQCVIMVLFEGLTWLKDVFIFIVVLQLCYCYQRVYCSMIEIVNILTTLEKIIILLTFSKNGRYNLQVMWNLKLFMNHHWRWLLSSGGCKYANCLSLSIFFFFYWLFVTKKKCIYWDFGIITLILIILTF